MDRKSVFAGIVCTMTAAISCWPVAAFAAMTLEQMKVLQGAAQLEMTLDEVFKRCGLPAAIVDHGADTAKQSLKWQGTTAMRLSPMDWDTAYGVQPREQGPRAAWVNSGKSSSRCASGLSGLLFRAKGGVGAITITKKPQGFGYVTTYDIPKDLYRAHKVVGVRAKLAKSLPASALAERYGQADEVLKQTGRKDRFRYWVLTLRENRPETLNAVDFEIEGGSYRSYSVSTSENDFVRQRLEVLLRKWEREYVLD